MQSWLFFILISSTFSIADAQQIKSFDICVYGASSGGVIAAYTAGRLGKKVILISESRHPGGLSSGGLGNTDIGNKSAITGLARDFYEESVNIMEKTNSGFLNRMWPKKFFLII